MFYFAFINNKKILKSDMLDCVEHFFTTRETCIKSKESEYEKIISENKKDICKYLNIEPQNLITPSQTHTANIALAHAGQNIYPDTDGLITTDPDIAIYLNFADCTPIIFYDKKQNTGAVSHAGWRGTAQKIAALTVEKMVTEFDSNTRDIIAVIGPAISKCCYNVGEDVANQLLATVADKNGLSEQRGENIFVDLKGINRQQILETGVTEIDVCPYCTVCDNDIFFSYRKENATTNRHSAVLKLNRLPHP